MRKALIVYGGWAGHEPDKIAKFFSEVLSTEDFEPELSEDLDRFTKGDLMDFHLIIPVWTMGEISNEQLKPVVEVVSRGVGLAGCHGGMCDAFRDSVEWQFMTGGNWVSHPGGEVDYTVNIKPNSGALVEGLEDFAIKSEQYYLHVDPAIDVLATTRFPTFRWYHSANGEVEVPVAWTKRWGLGRVYYNSLGHHADIIQMETPAEMMRRGFHWVAEGRDLAEKLDFDASAYESQEKMF